MFLKLLHIKILSRSNSFRQFFFHIYVDVLMLKCLPACVHFFFLLFCLFSCHRGSTGLQTSCAQKLMFGYQQSSVYPCLTTPAMLVLTKTLMQVRPRQPDELIGFLSPYSLDLQTIGEKFGRFKKQMYTYQFRKKLPPTTPCS